MAKEAAIEIDGTVEQVLPNTTFRVLLTNGHTVLATIAGKMRRLRIRLLAGDRVTLAVSPYDLTRGRITFRHKLTVRSRNMPPPGRRRNAVQQAVGVAANPRASAPPGKAG